MRIEAESSNHLSQIASAASSSVIKIIQLRLSIRWGKHLFVSLGHKPVSANYSFTAFRVLALGEIQEDTRLVWKFIYINI